MSANLASDPSASSWVMASAGSGKTHLLVRRTLRLLLKGESPPSILCITYTKAAAAEMAMRIESQLASWTFMEQEALTKALEEILGRAPKEEEIIHARMLFAKVLDSHDGPRILTIHAFCQSLLGRFPLEAAIPPHFSVIDEPEAMSLLQEARLKLLSSATPDQESLYQAIDYLARRMGDAAFADLLDNIIAHRSRFARAFANPMELVAEIYKSHGFEAVEGEQALLTDVVLEDREELGTLVAAMREKGSKNDQKQAELLGAFLACELSAAGVMAVEAMFMTQKGTPRKDVLTAGLSKQLNPSQIERLHKFGERICALSQTLRNFRAAFLTQQVVVIAEHLLAFYDAQKRARALLDFDDLILQTAKLLERRGIGEWIAYKLDGGIRHLLIDEAQDTSPEQWQLLSQLVTACLVEPDRRKSFFIVGDPKQSIFSFQGADPESFRMTHRRIETEAREQGAHFATVPLTTSYRSAPEVLQIVDRVSNLPEVQRDLMEQDDAILHQTVRKSAAGLVELWPLIGAQEETPRKPWALPGQTPQPLHPSQKLAKRIASTIALWLKEGKQVDGRRMTAGDVMILLRRRNRLANDLIRALKREGVNVAGSDRLRLSNELAVQDLLAILRFLLLPEDDLTLATVLKTPLIGWDEDQLFALAYGRGEQSLWQRLLEQKGEAWELLSGLFAMADYMPPFELIGHILETLGGRKRWAARLGMESLDALEEFHASALQFEHFHAPSLQGFVQWFERSEAEIKRDMEQGRDEVRIMTVHGAKGLQAPIVFLADTTSVPQLQAQEKLLWDRLPGALGYAEEEPERMKRLRLAAKDKLRAEYHRLLYVAMTRAADQLFICGWHGKRDPEKNCWYRLIEEGLKDVVMPGERKMGGESLAILRVGEELDAAQAASGDVPLPMPLPDALLRLAPEEPRVTKPLTPSKPEEEAPPAASPVQPSAGYRRGQWMHRLLEWLPELDQGQRAAVAEAYLNTHAGEISAQTRVEMIREIFSLIEDSRFATVFAPGSRAEVPISGVIRDRVVSGQIDRLAVSEREVLIVDYKTGPKPASTPAAYLRQMALYRELLASIYPGRKIRSALIWTASAEIEELEERLLLPYAA